MDSSIKQWHKSVLFASVALLALGGTAMAQPSDYISGPQYILNAFEVTADGFLNGLGVWAVGEEGYALRIYDSLAAAMNNGTFLASGTGESFSAGYVELALGASISVTAGETYYARVRAYDLMTHGASFVNPLDNVSYFGFNATTWYDLFDDYANAGLSMYGGGAVTAPANFVTSLLMSAPPNITAFPMLGNWSIDSQQFTGPKTLDMNLTAGEMKPFVTEIEVSSDMANITITEEVLNNISERDWIGYGFQLGFWDDVNDRFVGSTPGDGLSFGFSSSDEFGPVNFLTEDSITFGSGLVVPGESAAFQLLINLPGGVDNFTFALRQYAVPEPSSFLLLAMSGVILLCSRRRR